MLNKNAKMDKQMKKIMIVVIFAMLIFFTGCQKKIEIFVANNYEVNEKTIKEMSNNTIHKEPQAYVFKNKEDFDKLVSIALNETPYDEEYFSNNSIIVVLCVDMQGGWKYIFKSLDRLEDKCVMNLEIILPGISASVVRYHFYLVEVHNYKIETFEFNYKFTNKK